MRKKLGNSSNGITTLTRLETVFALERLCRTVLKDTIEEVHDEFVKGKYRGMLIESELEIYFRWISN